MRAIAWLIPLAFVTACGGEAETNDAASTATTIVAGQWELTSEVSDFRAVDQGQPKIDTPTGTRATNSVCVGADTRPPTALFAGDGYACEYGAYYVRNGRINVTLACTREGLSGSIPISAEGRITDEGIEFNRTIRTVLASDGDVEITAAVTGRRTGDCVAEADPAGNAATPAG